jgi:hypothetical protein
VVVGLSERNIVDPHWDDELIVLQRFLHRVGDRNLVAHATVAAFAARSGNYRDNLGSLLPDRVFYATQNDVPPERSKISAQIL